MQKILCCCYFVKQHIEFKALFNDVHSHLNFHPFLILIRDLCKNQNKGKKQIFNVFEQAVDILHLVQHQNIFNNIFDSSRNSYHHSTYNKWILCITSSHHIPTNYSKWHLICVFDYCIYWLDKLQNA